MVSNLCSTRNPPPPGCGPKVGVRTATVLGVGQDAIDEAFAEAERRRAISDLDLSSSVRHFREVVHAVCRDWSLSTERWLDGGAGTPPLAVRRDDGTAAVLKIGEPGDLDQAVRVLHAADGHGYARVLAWEADRGALLLERLGGSLRVEARSLRDEGRVLVPLLQDAWTVPLTSGRRFEGKARGLLSILGDLGPRYGEAREEVLGLAREYAEWLAASEQAEVVCHGDPHAANVLRRGAGWALIDPDGFVGERAYDLGVVIRDACRELEEAERATPGGAHALLREESLRIAASAGVDPERVWRWGFVERVTTGLYLRWFGYVEESATFLDTATLLARAAGPG